MIAPEKLNWKAKFHRTIKCSDGLSCDMWILVRMDNPEIMVSVGVPTGRDDIIHFIETRCKSEVN